MKETRELGRVYSPFHIRDGLLQPESIIYTDNGNRTILGKKLLKKLEELAPKLGIERIGDISFFAPTDYPVYQSCRPNIWTHGGVGQNTGSQGKGPHAVQAKISCLMETIEGYCAEPKNLSLIRGSYRYLRNQHVIVDPRTIPTGANKKPSVDDAFMWCEAYSVALEQSVLVPAEAVYFPFMAIDFDTKPIFTTGSNGLGAGGTYLEAVIHGLYEVIERHYWHLFEKGQVKCDAIIESELGLRAIEDFEKTSDGEFDLQLYRIQIPGIENLPVILCLLMGTEEHFLGFGCSMTLDISISRAISEAFQGMATIYSGTREDLYHIEGKPMSVKLFSKTPQPKERTLSVGALKRSVINKSFRDLRSEYLAIVKWLKTNGFEQVYISNLTRVGVEIPVVRVLVPGLKLTEAFNITCDWDQKTIYQRQFQIEKNR